MTVVHIVMLARAATRADHAWVELLLSLLFAFDKRTEVRTQRGMRRHGDAISKTRSMPQGVHRAHRPDSAYTIQPDGLRGVRVGTSRKPKTRRIVGHGVSPHGKEDDGEAARQRDDGNGAPTSLFDAVTPSSERSRVGEA